ncbi:hypothetical protein UVI_02059050 [Ustilaginoidea virens]|uniref:ER membrane protein complex subunit 1 n=1 Tax=Ustilaginoidea virens TaxID=1159556 RepID=A0A1B5L538_USTVR|nr:hypothetical protein UVI_02059050 [Ustilaginoidea virens]
MRRAVRPAAAAAGLLLMLLLGLCTPAAAVFKDEVGDVDYHHALVGLPQAETTFFHRPRKAGRASLLYTLGDVGVVGAVNPSTGELVWRQHIGRGGVGGGHLRAPQGESWVASAHGSHVQAWDALTGRNIWEVEFAGRVRDLEILELTESSSRKDVLALFDEGGVTVLRRLHGALGSVLWEFRETSRDVPAQVSTNIADVYVLSLHGAPGAYSLKVTSLDMATGRRVDHWTVGGGGGGGGGIRDARHVSFVGANSAAPIAAWTDARLTRLSVNVLGARTKQDFALPDGTTAVRVHAPHLLQSLPHFLVHVSTASGHRAQVYHTDLKSGRVSKAYDLPHAAGPGAFSTSSDAANVYFTRITQHEVTIVSSESHGVLARWPLRPAEDGRAAAVEAVSEVVRRAAGGGGGEFAVRSAALTSGQDWILIRNGVVDWSRPEGLSGAVAAVWAEVPEAERLAQALAEEAHANPLAAYVHRVRRHLADLQHLPAYLARLARRVADGIISGQAADPSGRHQQEGLPPLRRRGDAFGFGKIAVLATRRGRFYGLDTGRHGKVLWSSAVFQPPQPGAPAISIKGLVVNDGEGTVTAVGGDGELAVVDYATGNVVQARQAGGATSPATKVAGTAVVVDAAAGSKRLLALDPDGLPVPDASTSVRVPDDAAAVVVVRDGDRGLKGVKLLAASEDGGKVSRTDLWQLRVGQGQRVVGVATPPSHNPVASIGRVLGDRRVAYKYLNPHTAVVAVADDAASTLSVRLVDTVSGQTLASQSYAGVDAGRSVSCAMAENWYSCAFFADGALGDGTNRTVKGFRIVTSDLFESPDPDDRGPLGDAPTFSSLDPVDAPAAAGAPLPWVVSQAVVVSQELQALTTTQTLQGITSRQLLAYLPESHGILAIPRHVLDPRRPVDRDPTAAEAEAESLLRYAPQLEVDARGIVTHERDVVGVTDMITTPAAVESTSLLLAYGIDVFGTRLSPSGLFDILGKGLNKATLVGTVLALFAGVLSLAPMIK